MRRFRSLPILSLLLMLMPVAAYSQAWSGILSPSRAIDWKGAGLPATLPDGETTANPWTPPTRPACTSAQAGFTVPIASSISMANLNTAIANCAAANPTGSYLLLASGTFNVNAAIQLYAVNNVTLRGSGPMSTTMNQTSGSIIFIGQFPSQGSGTLASSYSAGTKSITVTSASGTPVVGALAYINQCDTGSGSNIAACTTPSDNGSLFVCGDIALCTEGQSRGSSYNHQRQAVLITNVTNNGGGSYTLAISPGLYMPNWSTSLGATVTWNNLSNQVTGIGLEDLTVSFTGATNSANYLVQASQAYASWIKGVRFVGSGASFTIKVTNSKNFLVFNNYCASQINLSSFHACYSLDSASDSLVLNNIAATGIGTEYDGGNSGLVTAYNFTRDAFTPYAENEFAFDHAAFSSFDLWEGNESGAMTEDDIWGTHALNTYFRNYLYGYDAPYVGGSINPSGFVLPGFQRFENLVGNVIGSPKITTYQGQGNGNAFNIYTSDALVASTLLRWGNATNITQGTDTAANSGVRFASSEVPFSLSSPNTAWQNPVPGSQTLPCSFFLAGYTSTTCTPHPNGGTGLSWWKVCKTWTTFPTACATTQTQPFPATGPDVSSGPYVNGHTYDIPAQIAWYNLPIDSTLQNSYTITSSSWSGGVETLTFATGLPTFNCGGTAPCNLLGPFQLSGVNAACSTGATFGPNSEIYIINGGATTVQYALTSNPGVSCTGTMLFPDVRQFDERVYAADSTSTPPPPPPSSLTATVQ